MKSWYNRTMTNDINIYSLWSTGYSVSAALSVEISGESEKAMKFTVLGQPKCSFWLPKKAVKFDPANEGIITLAGWFTKDSFLKSMFDRYGNHYKR